MILPPNVTASPDRHGKIRYRFRRAGFPSRYINAEPGSVEFEEAYAQCAAAEPLAGRKIRRKTRSEHLEARFGVSSGEEFVYFIGAKRGPIKIGTSANVAVRLGEIQLNHPYRIWVLACSPGGRDAERAYHRKFQSARMRGEWFRRTPELMGEIARLCPTSKHEAK